MRTIPRMATVGRVTRRPVSLPVTATSLIGCIFRWVSHVPTIPRITTTSSASTSTTAAGLHGSCNTNEKWVKHKKKWPINNLASSLQDHWGNFWQFQKSIKKFLFTKVFFTDGFTHARLQLWTICSNQYQLKGNHGKQDCKKETLQWVLSTYLLHQDTPQESESVLACAWPANNTQFNSLENI